MTSPPRSLPDPSLTDVPRLVATLEEDIVLGRLHPRERLIEEDLVRRFGTTRHVTRQALAELARIGLIERFLNRGAQVRTYTAEEVEQLYEVRILLETEAARRVKLPLPAQDLEDLRAVQVVHDRAVESGDLSTVFRSNLAFHRTLFACCGNAFLASAIEEHSQRAHGIRFLSLTDSGDLARARAEHHQMIAAIEAGDQAELVRLCGAHLPPSKLAYLRAYGGLRA